MSKKIIFFIPTLSIGGGERVVSELSLNFPDSIKTTIVLFKDQISYPYKGKIIFLNIPLSNPFFLKVYYFFLCLFRFRKIVKEEKPDCVVSFGPPLNVINILSTKKNVLRVDNFQSASRKGLIYETMIRLFYNKASKIMCVSKASAQDLVKNFGIKREKIEVIYNPLGIKEIKKNMPEPLKPEHQQIFEKPVIITVGRLTKQKNQQSLVKAFLEVKNHVKDAKLVILGKGELESELKILVKNLKLENDAHFLGWQENPFKFLAKAKVFVLPSLWEGLPYVLLEAMACGIPVISVDCKSGPREILSPKTEIDQKISNIEYAEFGILTPPLNENLSGEKKLSDAIIKILSDSQFSNNLAKKSLERAEDFDIKNIIKKWNFLLP